METTFVDIKTVQIGADLSKVVDRIVRQYESFPVAFQKEAIQNAWDARKDKKTGKGWGLRIYTFFDSGKTHLVVEDFGTKGMNDVRWEAFQSLWKPEKSELDAGGQGQGKFVLMGASHNRILIIESISDNSGYKCKFLREAERSINEKQYIITDFIRKAKPLNHKGTKIWIYNVDRKFLKTVKSKAFEDIIAESWWQIFGDRFNAKIKLFDTIVGSPVMPEVIEESMLLENYEIRDFGRIKRLVFRFYDRQVPVIFEGIGVQRANMMIKRIPFEVHDKEYKGRFSGYIEFDMDLEIELKGIEKTDHCGFLYDSPWKEIQNIVKVEAQKFVNKIVPSKEKKVNIKIKNLNEIIQKANQIVSEFCPEIFGLNPGSSPPNIPKKDKPLLRIGYLTINKREVKFEDVIKPICLIVNEFDKYKRISLHIELKRERIKINNEEHNLKIFPFDQKKVKLSEIELAEETFQKGKYTLRVTILDENRHDIDTKSTSFYLETTREKKKRSFVKDIQAYESDEPLRNKPIMKGTIPINLGHNDFLNIYNSFKDKITIRNRQIANYFIKIIADEAINVFLRSKLTKSDGNIEIEDFLTDIRYRRDQMYQEIYVQ